MKKSEEKKKDLTATRYCYKKLCFSVTAYLIVTEPPCHLNKHLVITPQNYMQMMF